MKAYAGRRAPVMSKPERTFWAAFSRSLQGSARRRVRRSMFSALRRW